MKKFRHLHVPDHWEQYWSRYPQGYTILEALINWVGQVDDMVDNQNALNKTVEDFRKELDEFVEAFEPNLQEKVIDTLYEWQQSGFLDVVIDQALQTQIDDVSEQLAQITVNVRTFGAKGDAITDDTKSIQDAIDHAHSEGGTVLIPSGRYRISDTIVVKEGVRLIGVATPHIWDSRRTGSIIEYVGTGTAVQLNDDVSNISGLGIENIRITDVNNTGEVGLKVGAEVNWLHDIVLSQLTVNGFNTGIQVNKTYGIVATLVKSRGARENGWHFTPQPGGMTLSTFTSCGGYSATENGWFIERNINYSAFEQCYFDGCKTGFRMTGYTPNKELFKNCGVENFTEYAFYFSNPQMIVGISSPMIIKSSEAVQTIDNIYFDGVELALTNVYIPSSYAPALGYDVNVVNGRAVCTNVDITSLSGNYEGSYRRNEPIRVNRSQTLEARTLVVPAGSGTFSVDVRGVRSYKASTVDARRVVFTQARVGQVIEIFGHDDLNKFFIDNFDFPKIEHDIYLGKGDYARLVFDDLDGTGNAWHVVELKLDRVGAIPTTGYWERGRKFYHPNPVAGGPIGWVCVSSGTPGTWKSFGIISE